MAPLYIFVLYHQGHHHACDCDIIFPTLWEDTIFFYTHIATIIIFLLEYNNFLRSYSVFFKNCTLFWQYKYCFGNNTIFFILFIIKENI